LVTNGTVLERVLSVHPRAVNFQADGDAFTFNTGEDLYGIHSCVVSVYGETCEKNGTTRNRCAQLLREALDIPGNGKTR